MAGSAAKISGLLEKVSHYDKDERYMAVLDISTELSKDITLDSLLERKVAAAIVERLEKDPSNDVQAIAVKALSILVKKASALQVGDVCDRLARQLLEGREDLRDVYGIGLKTVISEAEAAVAPVVAKAIAPSLVSGLQQKIKSDVAIQCLDVAAALFNKMGTQVSAHHQAFLEGALRQLAEKSGTLRKRGISCIGSLSPVLSDALLEQLIGALLGGIDKKSKGLLAGADVPTLIQTIGAVSRQVGFRLGRHLSNIIPLLLSCMGDPADENTHNEASDELRENCLQAFESFLLRSPKEVSPYVMEVLDVTLKFIRYDPNYMGGEEGEGEGGEEDISLEDTEEEDDDGDYDDADYGDDDDTSWKVRRACAKVVSATIASRPQMMRELYGLVATPVIRRFSEREEAVRLEIIGCMTELVRTTSAGATVGEKGAKELDLESGLGLGFAALRISDDGEDDAMSNAIPSAPKSVPLMRMNSITSRLIDVVPALVRASLLLLKQKDAKSVRTRTAVLQMLRCLFSTLANMGADSAASIHLYIDKIIPTLIKSIRDKSHAHSAALRLEALSALRVLLVIFSPNAVELSEHLPSIVPTVVEAGRDDWYRLVAEVLRVIAVLATLLRPAHGRVLAAEPTLPADLHAKLATQLFEAVNPRLAAHDIDQEIKECAITAAAVLLAHAGDVPQLHEAVPRILSTYSERLRSEATRVQTLKALSYLALSPVAVESAPTLLKMLPEISAFVRQQSRTLRQQTLDTLQAIVLAQPAAITADVVTATLSNAATAIDDADLQLANHALMLAGSLIGTTADAAATEAAMAELVLPRAIQLSTSPVLQGAALNALKAFFSRAVPAYGRRGAFAFRPLLDAIVNAVKARTTGTAAVSAGFGKQCVEHAARIIATLCQHGGSETSDVIRKFIANGTSGTEPLESASLALHCLGELGLSNDIIMVDGAAPTKVMSCFSSTQEELKSAASFALGGICVGNMAAGLPHLLSSLEGLSKGQENASSNEQAYLLLSALREILLHHAPAEPTGPSFEAHLDSVMPILTSKVASASEEGVRNMVAECLGRAAAINAGKVIPVLLAFADSEVENLRWTAISSLRHAVAGSHGGAAIAEDVAAKLFKTITDVSLAVRLAALNAVNVAAYSSASHLLRPLLHSVESARFPIQAAGGAGVSSTAAPIAAASTVAAPDYEKEGLLACIYYEMLPRAELIREVNLGPFTHKQDDGLPLRKAAFAAVDTMLSSKLADKIGSEVVPLICSGLRDLDDVKMICHGLLMKMTTSSVWQAQIVAELSMIIDAMSVVLKNPEEKTGPPVDVLRSGLRAVDAISRNCADANGVVRFQEIVEVCSRDPGIAPIFAQVRNDAATR